MNHLLFQQIVFVFRSLLIRKYGKKNNPPENGLFDYIKMTKYSIKRIYSSFDFLISSATFSVISRGSSS